MLDVTQAFFKYPQLLIPKAGNQHYKEAEWRLQGHRGLYLSCPRHRMSQLGYFRSPGVSDSSERSLQPPVWVEAFLPIHWRPSREAGEHEAWGCSFITFFSLRDPDPDQLRLCPLERLSLHHLQRVSPGIHQILGEDWEM